MFIQSKQEIAMIRTIFVVAKGRDELDRLRELNFLLRRHVMVYKKKVIEKTRDDVVDKKKENKLKAVVKITRAIKKVHYRNEVPKFRGIKAIQTGNHEHPQYS
jgi:hypothetical protein